MFWMSWIYLLLFIGGVKSQLSFCGVGWTFEKSCLGLSYPSAYMDGKNGQPAQCVIALEDESAVSTQIENKCAQIKDKRGVSAVPYDSTSGTVDQLEKYFALKQTGFYYAASGKQVIPTSGKKTNVQGYLCSLKDTYGCAVGWFRYGSYCYLPRNASRPFIDAQNDCMDKEGTLPRIVNDEENKFVAMLAREQIFKDALGKNEIWGPLEYFPDDNLWQYADLDVPDRKVLYMRWWSTASGTYPVINKPSTGFISSTIFTGRNDKDKTAYFGYWGTSKATEPKQYICRRPLHLI